MSLPYCDTKTGSTHVNKHNINNYNSSINNASNISYSVKDKKIRGNNNNKHIHTINPYDNNNGAYNNNNIKPELHSANMSPISQAGRNEDQRFINSIYNWLSPTKLLNKLIFINFHIEILIFKFLNFFDQI